MATAQEIRDSAQAFIDASEALSTAQTNLSNLQATAELAVVTERNAMDAAIAAYTTALQTAQSLVPGFADAQAAVAQANTDRTAAAQALFEAEFEGV